MQAVQQNLTSETLMDAALRRVLTVRYRTGADDPEVCNTHCLLSLGSLRRRVADSLATAA